MISAARASREASLWRALMPKSPAGRAFAAVFFIWWALLFLFNVFPQIDIYASTHFFVRQTCQYKAAFNDSCGYFPYRDDTYLELLRTFCFRLPYAVAAVMLWRLAVYYSQYGATFNMEHARAYKVALGSLIIGPVILTNLILKTYWGRPRPSQTLDFGGHLDFVPAGSMVGRCVSNCSFISGEAAGAGWVFCLILLIPQPMRSALALPLAAISFLAPTMRVAFGAHYLSDVVLGWLSSVVVFTGLLALTDSQQGEKKTEI